MAEKYFLKLEHFEGPLDLLLYLVKSQELNIFDVNLFILTSQYLEFLRVVEFKSLQEASTFIEMAASLTEIKSRSLLPLNEEEKTEEDIEQEESPEDIRNRLIAYDLFKRLGAMFSDLSTNHQKTYTNHEWMRLEEKYESMEKPLKGDKHTLLVLYEQMLSAISDKKPNKIAVKTDSLPLDQVIEKVKDYIKELNLILLQKLYKRMNSRYELVAYILAMLQLVRDREAKVLQEKHMGPLWFYAKDQDEASILNQVSQTHSPQEIRP